MADEDRKRPLSDAEIEQIRAILELRRRRAWLGGVVKNALSWITIIVTGVFVGWDGAKAAITNILDIIGAIRGK